MTILENGKRENNSNIEETFLRQNLAQRGYNDAQISRAIELLKGKLQFSEKPIPTQSRCLRIAQVWSTSKNRPKPAY